MLTEHDLYNMAKTAKPIPQPAQEEEQKPPMARRIYDTAKDAGGKAVGALGAIAVGVGSLAKPAPQLEMNPRYNTQ